MREGAFFCYVDFPMFNRERRIARDVLLPIRGVETRTYYLHGELGRVRRALLADEAIAIVEHILTGKMCQCEICPVAKGRDEIANHLPITRHRFFRAHLFFELEPVLEPVFDLVILHPLAVATLPEFRPATCERPVR